MLTISEQANKEIQKAQKAIGKALDILTALPEYENKSAIFHASTVHDVNRLITAIEHIRD